jgi:hypothetical protein
MSKWLAALSRKLDAPQTQSGPFGEEKSDLLPTENELRVLSCPARTLLTNLNALPQPTFIQVEWLKTTS